MRRGELASGLPHWLLPLLLALPLLGCSAAPSEDAPTLAPRVLYHFTRILPGSGVDASVASDGTIAALSEVSGQRWVSVLNREGNLLGFFQIDPFVSVVRAAALGEVVASAADGRVRRFRADGSERWTTQLDYDPVDLVANDDGGAIVTGQQLSGVVDYLSPLGVRARHLTVRAAPFVARDDSDGVVLTSRDLCRVGAVCGAGFVPDSANAAPVAGSELGGRETSAAVLLDAQGVTSGGFVANVDESAPVGPLFIRAGLLGDDLLAVQATAVAAARTQTWVDVDPSLEVRPMEVDTDASPDNLLLFAGRTLQWARHVQPLDDSGRAHIVGLFANRHGVVVDVNGDVYKAHHILQLAPTGELRFRYDVPNDGIADDVRLAGVDGAGHIVLSGRFEGTRDFDPGPLSDARTASVAARRYVTVLSAAP